MITFNPDVLDRLVAPGISRFSEAMIPDVASEFAQSDYWLTNHFLNNLGATLGGVSFRPPARQVVINYLKAAQFLFFEYSQARSKTLEYLTTSNPESPSISRYYLLVHHWSNVFVEYLVAVDLCNEFNDRLGDSAKVFATRDETKECRASDIANSVKHIRGRILEKRVKPEHTLPLWLTNSGIESFQVAMTYDEVADVVRDVGKFADELEHPYSFIEKHWPKALSRILAQRRDEAV